MLMPKVAEIATEVEVETAGEGDSGGEYQPRRRERRRSERGRSWFEAGGDTGILVRARARRAVRESALELAPRGYGALRSVAVAGSL